MRSVLLVALACLTSGCVTAIRGSTTPITVTADRDSAFVFVDGLAAGIAPIQVEVRRSRSHRIEVVLDSFRIAQSEIGRSFNPAMAIGSVLLGGGGGLAVDVSTGAVYELAPSLVRAVLVPDTAGVDAAAVAALVRQARQAATTGFDEADPSRRRAPPWLTVQLASGIYVGDDPDSDDGTTGGVGAALLVGARGPHYSARLSATASGGFLFDNSDRWEVAALVGVITETAGGRLRLGLSAGPGLTGGHESTSCFLCDSPPHERDPLPTHVGLSLLGEAHLFIVPQLGLGLHIPANLHIDEALRGIMIGVRFEGL